MSILATTRLPQRIVALATLAVAAPVTTLVLSAAPASANHGDYCYYSGGYRYCRPLPHHLDGEPNRDVDIGVFV